MAIYIDPRGDTAKFLLNCAFTDQHGQFIHISSRPLANGDVEFYGTGPNDTMLSIGIEIKNIPDLISSLASARLQSVDGQLQSMIHDSRYDVNILLVYGRYRETDDGGIQILKKTNGQWRWKKQYVDDRTKYHKIQSFLTQCQLSGVLVEKKENIKEVARYILSTYCWFQKPWHEHKQMKTFSNISMQSTRRRLSTFPDLNRKESFLRRVRIARCFPRIDFERALSLAYAFPNIIEMIDACVGDLIKIPGIGRVVANEYVDSVLRNVPVERPEDRGTMGKGGKRADRKKKS